MLYKLSLLIFKRKRLPKCISNRIIIQILDITDFIKTNKYSLYDYKISRILLNDDINEAIKLNNPNDLQSFNWIYTYTPKITKWLIDNRLYINATSYHLGNYLLNKCVYYNNNTVRIFAKILGVEFLPFTDLPYHVPAIRYYGKILLDHGLIELIHADRGSLVIDCLDLVEQMFDRYHKIMEVKTNVTYSDLQFILQNYKRLHNHKPLWQFITQRLYYNNIHVFDNEHLIKLLTYC